MFICIFFSLFPRAYSHMAQIYFSSKDYEKCIFLYKQILHTIEMSLLDDTNANGVRSGVSGNESNEKTDEMNDFDYDLNGLPGQNSRNNETFMSNMAEPNNNDAQKYNTIRDERLIQMIVIRRYIFFLI